MKRKVTHFRRVTTLVDTMTEAWSFVMEHVDDFGPAPSVTIEPVWGHFDGLPPEGTFTEPPEPPQHFEVSVSGSHEVPPTPEDES